MTKPKPKRPWSVPDAWKRDIIRLHDMGFRQTSIAKYFGLSKAYVSRIISGERGPKSGNSTN